jgi:hypothetical protein
VALRTVKIKKITNGYVTTTQSSSRSYEYFCKDFGELCDWINENLNQLDMIKERKCKELLK